MAHSLTVVLTLALAGAAAFSPARPAMMRAPSVRASRFSRVAMQEDEETIEPTSDSSSMAEEPMVPTMTPPAGWKAVDELWSDDKKADFRVEGGKTLKTFKNIFIIAIILVAIIVIFEGFYFVVHSKNPDVSLTTTATTSPETPKQKIAMDDVFHL